MIKLTEEQDYKPEGEWITTTITPCDGTDENSQILEIDRNRGKYMIIESHYEKIAVMILEVEGDGTLTFIQIAGGDAKHNGMAFKEKFLFAYKDNTEKLWAEGAYKSADIEIYDTSEEAIEKLKGESK